MKSLKYHFLWLIVGVLGTFLTMYLLGTAMTEVEHVFLSVLLGLYWIGITIRIGLIMLTLWARLEGY